MTPIRQSRTLVRASLGTVLLLLVPLVAMQFTDEVDWDVIDFVVAGGLLFGAGLTFGLTAKMRSNFAYRAGAGLAVAAALLLVWINLAVGVMGNSGDPANWIYIWVLAIAIIGGLIVRFKPHGMALVLLAAALAQILIAVVTQTAERGPTLLNGFFATLWLAAAYLFQRAAKTLPR